METIELHGIDEKIYYSKVLDMMPVYIWQNEKVNSVFSSLNVHYGSIHQEFKIDGDNKLKKVPSGIAHFIEHLNFYESEEATATDFYSECGSEVNAFTTFDYTSYHVYSTSDVKKNLDHLLDFVLTPFFTKKTVNKERKIIIEELRQDLDMPDTELYFKNYENLFHKYKYSELITGSESDIKNTNLEDIQFVYDTFYHPENMFLVVTGNVNPYEIEKIVEDNLKSKVFQEFKHPKVKHYKEPTDIVNEYTEITGNVETNKIKISVKTPISAFKNINEVELRLMVSIILNSNFGPTSDLKEELMEADLISYMQAGRTFIEDYLIITVSVETKYPKEVIKRISDALDNLLMTEENLKRKINSNVATLVLNYDDISTVNHNIQGDILSFKKIIEDVKDHLEGITLDMVLDVIKKINTDNKAITVLKKND